jgi:hypothetical protein
MSRLVIFIVSLRALLILLFSLFLIDQHFIEGRRCTCIYMSILRHIEASRIATEDN